MYRTIEQLKQEKITFDWALPQTFYDAVTSITGLNPSQHIVWAYPKGLFGGTPCAVTEEGRKMLKEYNVWEHGQEVVI